MEAQAQLEGNLRRNSRCMGHRSLLCSEQQPAVIVNELNETINMIIAILMSLIFSLCYVLGWHGDGLLAACCGRVWHGVSSIRSTSSVCLTVLADDYPYTENWVV